MTADQYRVRDQPDDWPDEAETLLTAADREAIRRIRSERGCDLMTAHAVWANR